MAVLAGPLFVIWFLMPSGMGFGDVRLTVLLGWTVGLCAAGDRLVSSAFMAVVTLTIAAVLGVAFGIVGISARGLKSRVPFGPPLATAALLCIACAGPILRFFEM
jgi:leader peptidase (prepilin peptidase)/N-methyltransferase